jgi:hypothetical protein
MTFAHSIATTQTFSSDEPNRGFFHTLLAALMHSRQREADREIARYLDLNGGKLTDGVEREIERRFLSNPVR